MAIAVVLARDAPFPVTCCAVLAAGYAACWAIRLRGRSRILLANAAAILVLFLAFELVACAKSWLWFGGSVVSQGPAAAPGVPAHVVRLVRSARARPSWPPAALQKPLIHASHWIDDIDARGLRVRASAPLFSPRRPHAVTWLLPSRAVRVVKYHQGVTLFDVVYTTSRHGFRITRPTKEEVRWPDHMLGTALFFGGSFTFGDAVNDHQTLPAYITQQSGGRLRARNLGLGGAGAHEMLAMLEANVERRVLEGEWPVLAVYLLTADHIREVLGRMGAWQLGRPHYVLRDGVAVRDGDFGDERHPLIFSAPLVPLAVSSRLCVSALLCQVLERLSPPPPIDAARGVELWRAVVRRAAALLRERYGLLLLTVLWEMDPGLDAELVRALDGEGLQVLSTGSLFPPGDRRFYTPVDGHPNSEAYATAAQALLDRIDDGTIRLTSSASALADAPAAP